MSVNAKYAFVLTNEIDWKLSTVDDWDWSIIEIEGTEKTLGHHRIDGKVYKVLRTGDNQVVAVAK